MPITMMFAADVLGVQYGQYLRDRNLMVDAQIKTAGTFGLDHVSAIGYPAVSLDFGAKIRWYDDQPPAKIEEESLFADKSVFMPMRDPCQAPDDCRQSLLRGIEQMRRRAGNDLIVEGWTEGPCAQAADLRGINRLMVDFYDDPGFVRDLFDFTLEITSSFAVAQVAAGADIVGVGDAAASLVGPRVYNELIWPWEKKLVDRIHAAGGKVRLHICGNTRAILAGMGSLECDLVDIDYPVPMDEARSRTGPGQALSGNLDPVRSVRNGTAETIAAQLDGLHSQVGARWVVAAGCEIVRDTPHANLHALVHFARTHHCPKRLI